MKSKHHLHFNTILRLLFLLFLIWPFLFGCSPMRLFSSISAEKSTSITQHNYGNNKRQSLNVFTPGQVIAHSPVIVFFYGGSWKRGDKAKYGFVGHSLSAKGYITVIPDYRLYPQVVFPAFVEDGAKVISWIMENIEQAQNGVVVMGHSAGAHTAALLALDHSYLAQAELSPDLISGVVGLAGPYGFNPLDYRSTRPIFADTKPIDKARPVTFACTAKAPMLLFHGADDGVVIPENSRKLKQKVENCGGSVDYRELADTGHFTIVLGLSDSFLAKNSIRSPLDNFLQSITSQNIKEL